MKVIWGTLLFIAVCAFIIVPSFFASSLFFAGYIGNMNILGRIYMLIAVAGIGFNLLAHTAHLANKEPYHWYCPCCYAYWFPGWVISRIIKVVKHF